MKKILLGMLVLPFILFSCGSARDNIQALVPEGAAAYIEIDNLSAFLENTDHFARSTGLKKILTDFLLIQEEKTDTNKSIEELLKAQLSKMQMDPEWFNLKKTAGAAVMPPENKDMSSIEFILLLPMKNKESFIPFEKFLSEMPGMPLKIFRARGNYAALYFTQKEKPAFPPEKSLELTEVQTGEKGALTLFLNLKNVMDKSIPGKKDLSNSIIPMLRGMLPSSGMGTGVLPALEKAVGGILDTLFQLESLNATLVLDEYGITLYGDLGYGEESHPARLQEKLKAGTGIKSRAKYISADSLFSTLTNYSQEAFKGYMNSIMQTLKESGILNEDKMKIYQENEAVLLKYSGPKQAISFDFDIDTTAIAESGGRPGAEKIAGAPAYEIFFVIDLNNKKEFRNSMEKIVNSGLPESFTGGAMTGLPQKIHYEKDKRVKDFFYDEVVFNTGPSLPGGNGMDREPTLTREATAPALNQTRLFIHYTNKKAYITAGPGGLDMLIAFAQNDGLKNRENSLGQSRAISHFWSSIPDDSHIIGQIAVMKIFLMSYGNARKNVMEPDDSPKDETQNPAQKNLPGIIWYVKMKPRHLETAVHWNSVEIKLIMDSIKEVQEAFSKNLFENP